MTEIWCVCVLTEALYQLKSEMARKDINTYDLCINVAGKDEDSQLKWLTDDPGPQPGSQVLQSKRPE